MRVLLVAALTCALVRAQALFPDARRDYRVDESLSNLATGDVNGDGKVDIALSNAVLLGKGDGTFEPPRSAPPLLALLDANGDGHLDYVASTRYISESQIAVYLGQGDGTFGAEIVSAVPFEPHQVLSADWNGDGVPDLALIERQYDRSTEVNRPYRLAMLLGDGSGSFQVTGEAVEGTAFALADWNADGKTDLIRISPIGPLESSLHEAAIAEQVKPTALLASADIDGDGKLDLLLVDEQVSVWRGNGDGTFQAPSDTLPQVGFALAITADDWDGDGSVDLIVYSRLDRRTYVILVFRNDGAGQLLTARINDIGLNLQEAIQLSDANGDGVLDVIAGYSDGFAISIARGRPDATVHTARVLPDSSLTNVVTGDLNGDGVPDLAGASAGRLHILTGTGSGEFTATGVSIPGGFALADLNSDGLTDILASSQGGTRVYANRGGLRFEEVSLLPGESRFPNLDILATDLNGDGRIDLITNSTRGPSAWINQGGWRFAASVPMGNMGNVGGSLAAGDVNGDGRMDVVISQAGGFNYHPDALLLLLGNGGGAFRPAVNIGIGSGVTVGDFNGDGKLDIATMSPQTNFIVHLSIAVLHGNGDGTFQPPVLRSIGKMSGSGWAVLTSADLNADGVDDVIWGCYSQIALLLGTRGDGLGEPTFRGGTRDIGSVAIADFDLDGTPDLATGSIDGIAGLEAAGPIAILFNKPSH
ncbi:MAG: VCBS repeat-containing protein [Bryobacterales bacterium]|nr:VCBS repeat-containing protein [Bryobacterales bacterium]